MRITSPRNFWAGLMFLAFGLFFAIWAIVNYQMGTAVRMGPAYFPTVLGGLLAFLGLIVLGMSVTVRGEAVDKFHFRPLVLILLANVAYGYLMKPLGLVLATLVLVFIAALGGHEFKWKEVIVLAAVLAAGSYVAFIWLLKLQMPVWPSFIA